MKNLCILAAALSAGLTTFAAQAEDITLNGEKLAALSAEMRAAGKKSEAAGKKGEAADGQPTKSQGQERRPGQGGKKAAQVSGSSKAAAPAAKAAMAEPAPAKKDVVKPRKRKAAVKANTAGAGKVKTARGTGGKKPAKETAIAAKQETAAAKPRRGSQRKRVKIVLDMSDPGSIAALLPPSAEPPTPAPSVAARSSPKQDPVSMAIGVSGGNYGPLVARYAMTYGVPVKLAHAVIQVESNYRPYIRGSAGEIGLMQIKPATARLMGYQGSPEGLFDPETNIKWGMKYLGKAKELGGGTTCGTILKYNAGHSARGMNPVSAAYCVKVERHLAGA